MNTTSNRKSRLSAWMLTAVMMLAAVLTACTKAEEELEPVVKPGDVVTDFKKVKPYGATQQFQTDLDALVTYALDIRAMRWAYFNMASKGFGSNEPFSATMDDIDNNKTCRRYAESVYNIIDAVVQNADAYEQAMQRLEDSQVLVRETPQTRGILSDAWGFITSCKKTQTMGRKSVVTIMRELGWTSNAAKLQEVYRSLPSELRRGYSSSQDFWRDFSTGALDSRANQVFVNLYNYADPEFGDKARDLDITPGKNITVAGAELIEKGSALVIDACPISTQIGYGKDAFDAINATANLVKKGDVKGFLQNAANNLINYGRDVSKLADKMRGLDINYWDYGDQFWDYVGKDISTVLMNDVCFNEHFGESDDTGELIPNMVKTKDRNGQEITLLIMVDSNSGKTTISCVFDKDGNIITNPDLPGKKQITVVNRHTGKRSTKTITVPAKGETEVEVDLEFDEVMLEEIPEKGDLSVSPSPLTIASTGGNYKAMIVTNYLYYTCSTKDDWLKASIASDVNYLYVSASKNETGQQRRGSVTVSATDSKGKVLKSTVLTVVQEVPEVTEYWVSATPSTVQFDKDGGKQEVVIDHSNALNYVIPVIGDDLIGWCDLSWKETATGWNIVVDVDPNTTGKERAGTFLVYVASNQKDLDRAVKEGVFDKQLVAATTVMVKQSAEAELKMTAIKSMELNVKVKIKDVDTGKESSSSFTFSNFDSYELTQQGTTVHLKFIDIDDDVKMQNGFKRGYYITKNLEFDITGFTETTGWLRGCKVKNLAYTSTWEAYYGEAFKGAGEDTYDKRYTEMKVSNMDAQPDSSPNYLGFGGESRYHTIEQFSYKELIKDYGKPERQHVYGIVDDSENIVNVSIGFEFTGGK